MNQVQRVQYVTKLHCIRMHRNMHHYLLCNVKTLHVREDEQKQYKSMKIPARRCCSRYQGDRCHIREKILIHTF